MTQQTAHKQRIQWIDAMRGVTIILVVFSHIWTFSLDTPSIVNNFFSMFRMPLFFCVSGFIAYRAGQQWNRRTYGELMLKKARVQLIPMLFFGLLFSAIIFSHKYQCSIPEAFKCFFLDQSHLGYWFTQVLLMMFIIYYTLSLIFRNNEKCLLWVMAAIAAIFYGLSLPGTSFYAKHPVLGALCFYQLFLYFQFFFLGNIIARKQNSVFQQLDKRTIAWGIWALFFALFTFSRVIKSADINNLLITITNKGLLEAIRLTGMISMVTLFYRLRKPISNGNRLSQCLQFVGQRTLDVYLIHFFLLHIVTLIAKNIQLGDNQWVVTLFSFLMAFFLTALSLLISRIIRLSPFLAYYLLGVKRQPKA